VASLTKPVFAELVLRLAAEQRLSLDEPMAPTWVDPDIAADPRHRLLTPRLVLSHRTGFANWRRATGGVLRFQTDPGGAYGYSGEGYEYLARFVERRAGASLDSLARRYIFRPFGMVDAAFTPQPWFEGRIARPSSSAGAFGEPAFSARGNAADELYSTVGDYARFVAAVMRGADLPSGYARQRDSVHVLDPGTMADCKPTARVRCPEVAGPGLGWAVMRFAASSGRPAETILWHTGSDEGMRAMVVYLPARRQGAVMFANGANGFQTMIDVGRLLFAESAFSAYLLSGRE
jgi:CubicO group peptidase (beta-lactamase class C family)